MKICLHCMYFGGKVFEDIPRCITGIEATAGKCFLNFKKDKTIKWVQANYVCKDFKREPINK